MLPSMMHSAASHQCQQSQEGFVELHAGLLYSQARALLAPPRAQVLVRCIISALAINGGQRFAAQAGETAGRAS